MWRSALNFYFLLVLVMCHLFAMEGFAFEVIPPLVSPCGNGLGKVERNERAGVGHSPGVGPNKEHWLINHPELQAKLEAARKQFLIRRASELQQRTDIPHLTEVKFNGKTLPVVHFLGAGYGGDGSAYIVKDGARERIIKVMRSKANLKSHQNQMDYLKKKGLSIVETLEVDQENSSIELDGTIGLSLDTFGDLLADSYGFTKTEVALIQNARQTHFDTKYQKGQINFYDGNLLMDIVTGEFKVLDPH